MFQSSRYAYLLGAALLLAQPGFCANLVSGGSFDSLSDLSFWQNVGLATTVSGTQDHTGGGSSSLQMENMGGIDGVSIYQCILITPNQSYSFSAYVLQPAAKQTASGDARLRIDWWESADCKTSAGYKTVYSTGSTNDQWELLEGEDTAPSVASSARIRIDNWNVDSGGTGTHVVYFDDVYLPEPDANILAIAALVSLYTISRFRRAA